MKEKTINLYTFEELTEDQQAEVIEKNRDYYSDTTCNLIEYDEAHVMKLEEQGFINPKISYSLNYCQGDGASFTCKELDFDLLLKDYKHAHKDWLLNILKNYCEVQIERSYSCHYVHERSCNTELYEYTQGNYPHIIDELDNIRQYIEDLRLQACETLAEDLQADIDYLTSDEAIAEALIINEYYFNGETLEIEL